MYIQNLLRSGLPWVLSLLTPVNSVPRSSNSSSLPNNICKYDTSSGVTSPLSAFTNAPKGACGPLCVSQGPAQALYGWSQIPVSATITAETVVTIINKRKNSTRVEIVTNTEADLTNFTKPIDVGSDGTRTQLVTDLNARGDGFLIVTLKFPTAYTQYDPTYTTWGVSSTGFVRLGCDALSSIKSNVNSTVFSFPSHPPIPQTTTFIDNPFHDDLNRIAVDPRGWSFAPRGQFIPFDNVAVQSFSPDLGLWSCTTGCSFGARPLAFSATALYLTDTSTSFEDGEDPQSLTDSIQQSVLPAIAVPASQTPTPNPSDDPSLPLAPSPAGATQIQLPTPTSATSEDQAPSNAASSTQQSGNQSKTNVQLAIGKNTEGQGRSVKGGLQDPTPVTQPLGDGLSTVITPSLLLTIGTETIRPNSQSQYVVNSQTLNPGGIITISETAVSLAANGKSAVIDGITTQLGGPDTISPGPLTLGTQVIQPDFQGRFSIDRQVLTRGGSITVHSTPIFLDTLGSIAVVGSVTENLASSSTMSAAAPLTFGLQTITADSQGRYIVAGQTLTPGGSAITVSGTAISLAAAGSEAFVGTSTERLRGVITSASNAGHGNNGIDGDEGASGNGTGGESSHNVSFKGGSGGLLSSSPFCVTVAISVVVIILLS